MVCCRCNRSGCWWTCRCVKRVDHVRAAFHNGWELCQYCSVQTPLPQAVGTTSLSPQNSMPGLSSSFTTYLTLLYTETPVFYRIPTCYPLYPLVDYPCAWDSAIFRCPWNFSELPAFSPATEPTFMWGSCDTTTFTNSAYDEVVHWKLNLFEVPFGKVGKSKSFVSELAKLFKALASRSAMESIAVKAAIVLSILLLQKPSSTSKAKEHSNCLDRCLRKWLDGDLNELFWKEEQYSSASWNLIQEIVRNTLPAPLPT